MTKFDNNRRSLRYTNRRALFKNEEATKYLDSPVRYTNLHNFREMNKMNESALKDQDM